MQEGDLLVAERPDLLAVDDHCTQQGVVLEQPHCDLAADTPEFDLFSERRNDPINLFFPHISNVHYPLAATYSSQWSVPKRPDSIDLPHELDVARVIAGRTEVKTLTVVIDEVTARHLAQTYRLVEHGIEHRLKIAG